MSSDMGATPLASGQSAPPATVTHTFTTPGSYTLIINVYNNAAGADSDSVVVQVA